ncbi:MAG: succinate dehydrogenase assembly factor 2 [Sulfitobacter sp.]
MSEELRAHKVKRLYMRSIRRGIKEMDLILTSFADRHLAQMDDAALDLYDAMLNENDHDLYQWVTGQQPALAQYTDLIEEITADFSPLK